MPFEDRFHPEQEAPPPGSRCSPPERAIRASDRPISSLRCVAALRGVMAGLAGLCVALGALAQGRDSGGLATSPGPNGAGAAASSPSGLPAASDPRWTRLGETAALVLYVDRSSLKREGAVRRVIEMQDLAAPDPEGVRSRRYANEYDCENKMHRIGLMSSFEGPQLTGRKLFDVGEWGYWRKIPPGGLFSQGYQSLCGPLAPSLSP